ncbi:hypothetical protein EYC80_010521 [Monilinia laxa]|uniref:TIP41-like protein n=1 Tax=Monilinia laxa TaxID=61186 RepID=A0A5N6JPU9_MONLA|nr:hypothetical protein EYC80_010521 [Monilinia laxa]
MAFNGPINETYPTLSAAETATVSHIQKGFKISARKLPISKSGPIDKMSEKLGIPVPEMIFGDNMVAIEHLESGWRIEFNAYDALDLVDKTDKNMLKVAYSKEWSSSREKTHEGIKDIVKPFDWSYTTEYKGTVTNGKSFALDNSDPIPIALLKRQDPILFFEEVVLLFMRLDNVLVRIRDTRIYVDFNTSKVIRDYTEKEDAFDTVKENLLYSGKLPDDLTIALRDPNQIAHLVPEVTHTIENLTLP